MQLIGLITLAVIVLAAVAGLLIKQRADAQSAEAAAASYTPAPLFESQTPQKQTTVAFIGDSYTAGTGASDKAHRWSSLVSKDLGWQESNLALGGTGYVTTAGKDGCGLDFCPAYTGVAADVVKAKPDVVIVSGGRNDRWKSADEVSAAADKLFNDLRSGLPDAKIYVDAPIWDDDPAPAPMAQIKSAVIAAAAKHGVTVLDIGEPLAGRADAVVKDGVHPNDTGHALIAKAVEGALKL
jgi:lysophospholipase L1-like esterase